MTALRDIATTPNASPSYDEDYAGWIEAQVALLRAGRLSELDLDNIAEELGDLGRSEFRELRSAYEVVLLHMLKWDHQPERRSRGWILSIREHRARASHALEENPSFRRRRTEAVAKAYEVARLRAARETDLDPSTFPEDCPYDVDAVLSRPFSLDAP
jgi:hypothetical protein